MWIHIWKLTPLFNNLWYFCFFRDHSAHAQTGQDISVLLVLLIMQNWTCLAGMNSRRAFGEKGMGSLWLQRRDSVKFLSPMCSTGLSSVHPRAETQPVLKPWDESHCLDTPTEPGMANFSINSMLVEKKLKPKPKHPTPHYFNCLGLFSPFKSPSGRRSLEFKVNKAISGDCCSLVACHSSCHPYTDLLFLLATIKKLISIS